MRGARSPNVHRFAFSGLLRIKKEQPNPVRIRLDLAEVEGFEPPWACTQTVFKTASL